MKLFVFLGLLSVALGFTWVRTSRESVRCLQREDRKLCAYGLNPETSRVCCDFEDEFELCGNKKGAICSDELEKLGEKEGYALAIPSEECKTTQFTVKGKGAEAISINISYVPPDLVCVLQVKNRGSYSSSLRIIEDEYTNIDALVYETNLHNEFLEKRGDFSSSETVNPVGDLRDFHTWYDNTSVVVVLAKNKSEGHGVFRALIHPLPAPEEDIEHIHDYVKEQRFYRTMFFLGLGAFMFLICVAPLLCPNGKRRKSERLLDNAEKVRYCGPNNRQVQNYIFPQQQLLEKVDDGIQKPNLIGTNELGECGYKMISPQT
ncbi:unnamed protein product [Moneuplotes crassus]|uniref:Uncharacterized protein n=1 Tax=Euplotes crassus TaxID=5936 RepID=A0AAD1XK03_EUPCR|nr:unnamed protein product [Moneuplotes crassus]